MAPDLSQDAIDALKHHGPPSASSKIPTMYETEVTPLIGSVSATQDEAEPCDKKRRLSSRAILILMGILVLTAQCGDQFQESPMTRIFESIYCYQHWEREDPSKILIPRPSIGPAALGGVEERWCKVAEVQGKVAMLEGTQRFLGCIPSFILSIPVGILADRFGRKPILIMGLCSFPLATAWQMFVCWFWQSFDLRFVWFSSLYALAGGGSPVISAICFVVISDVTNQENRSSVLLKISAANLVSNFICPPIAAWIMTFNPILAVFIGIACFAAGVPMSLAVPETLGYQGSATETSRERTEEGNSSSVSKNRFKGFMQRCHQPLSEAAQYFVQDKRVMPLICWFVPIMLTVNIVPLLLQYTSTRYNMTFSKATVLLSARAGLTIIIFLGIQPWISQSLAKAGMSGPKRDLLLARASALFMVVGWVAVGFAPNATLFIISLLTATLGNGFPVFLRSFLTGLVEQNKVAELYTIIGLIDTVGLALGTPLLAWLFKKGLQLGGMGIGIPFIFLGSMYVVVAGGLFRMDHTQKATVVEEDVETGDG